MQAILRDGSVLEIGDEVTTNYHKKCIGLTFIVCEINPYPYCESGTLVVAHLKDDPERRIEGLKVEGRDFGPPGIDANWFCKVKINV